MLLLRRKKGESILIGEDIRITVVECAGDGVRLAFDAPRNISILREELSQMEVENKKAAAPDRKNFSKLCRALKQIGKE